MVQIVSNEVNVNNDMFVFLIFVFTAEMFSPFTAEIIYRASGIKTIY